LVAIIAMGAGQAFAGANPEINLALDVVARSGKRTCTPAYASCSAITQAGTPDGSGYLDIIIVAYRYAELKGVEYGVDWDNGLYYTAFQDCADNSVIDDVTYPGEIACSQAWAGCNYAADPAPGTSGIGVGWLKLWTDGGAYRMDIVPNPSNSLLQALDCENNLDIIHTVHPGFVGMQPGGEDLPPCTMGPTANAPATWGGVKSLYR
jgi:hypothetical protein